MSIKAHIAEVTVKYVETPTFESFEAKNLLAFLEDNWVTVYSSKTDDSGEFFNWRIDKRDLESLLDDWDSLEWSSTEYSKDDVKKLLDELIKSSHGKIYCDLHWF